MNNYNSQQPQSPIELPQSHHLDKADQGCFKWYKIILYVYLVFGCLDIAYIIYLITKYSSLAGYCILAISLQSFLLFYVAFQLQAIQQRDLGKATLALIGFVIYLILYPIFSIGFPIFTSGSVDPDLVKNCVISLVSFVLFVLVGSIKVYLVLKEKDSQADGYRSMNNVTRNNATA